MELFQHLGKRIMAGTLAGIVSCAPVQPPFQAKDDYDTYPEYEKEIALYNITHILKENCSGSEGGANAEFLFCRHAGGCVKTGYSPNPVTGQLTSSCVEEVEPYMVKVPWKEIETVNVAKRRSGWYVSINAEDERTFPMANETQAFSLKKAIEVYLREQQR